MAYQVELMHWHENSITTCNFNEFKCPTFTECNEIVRLSNIVNHYYNKHKNMIVYQNFQIPQRSDIKANKLLMVNGKPFLLQLRGITSVECSVALCYIANQRNYNKYRVEVKAENGSLFFLDEQKIVKFNPEHLSADNITIVNFNALREILKGSNFNFKIHLIRTQLIKEQSKSNSTTTTTEQKDNVSDNKKQTETVPQTTKPIKDGLLEELECFVCKEYMIPPIFVCKTGHSLCNECKKRIQQCPLCSANYEGTRNIVLEKLTEHLQYPCRNHVHGCQFIDKLINLHKHEKDCLQIRCPLYILCDHKGSKHTIYQHLQQVHAEKILNLNQLTTYKMDNILVNTSYFVKYDDKVFQIIISYSWKPNLSWLVIPAIDNKTAIDNSKYKFIIDFIDQTNQERILTVGGLCESSKQWANYSITLPDHQLKPFIDNNHLLYFKLDLRKL